MKNIYVKSNVKAYCRTRKISMRQLSEMTGMSAACLYKRDNPNLQTIGKIMTALNCKFEDLFEIIEEK